MGLIHDLKLLRWQWRDRYGRFHILNSIWRLTPGELGFHWRARYIPRYFAAAGEDIRIHEGVRFRGVHKITCGDRVEIGVDNFLQASGGLTLGNRVMLGPGVMIWTVNHRFTDPDVPIAEQGYDYDPVVIEDDVWIGAGSFIMPGVHLPRGCIVSARSVVAKKRYTPWSILAGYPARVIGKRKSESEPAAADGAESPPPGGEESRNG